MYHAGPVRRAHGRRGHRKLAVVASLTIVGLLAGACSSDDDDSASVAPATSGGGTETTAAGAGDTTAAGSETTESSGGSDTSEASTGSDTSEASAGSGPSADDPDFITTMFASDGGDLGGGQTIKVGAGLLLGTSQAYYGQQSKKGFELAAKEIEAAGGPKFEFDVKDLTITPTAGADVARAWGESGIHLALAAGFFGTGSMIPIIAQHKIVTIDPGGGTSTTFQNKPFAWGGRAITPDDSLAGVVEYLKTEKPDAKRWAITGHDIGELTKGTIATLEKLAADAGAEIVGNALYALPGQGNVDYASVMSQLRGLEPDVIFNWAWGSDPAAFMKAYDTAGMEATVVGPDFGASTVDIAGDAFNGYQFAYDYFDATNPGNAWGEHFVKAFEEAYGESPDYYPANYYEDVFILWEVVKRVLADGGDLNDGDALEEAMKSDPTFPSVYGEGDPAGTIGFDPETHTLSNRPMGLFELQDGEPKPLAYFNIGGRDFEAA